MSQKIVAGFDGSEQSDLALRFAMDMAKRVGAELWVVIRSGPNGIPFDLAGTVATHRHELEARCEEELREVEHEAVKAGVRAKTTCVYGHSAAAILETAEMIGAELIVVGSNGAGTFRDGIFGSTVHHLLAHGTIPVTVVPKR